jgi:diguanylate cyclase (GGDEF)-like protein
MIAIAMCLVWLGFPPRYGDVLALGFGAKLLAQLTPVLLVAYITTMLSADIRRAYGHVKVLSETDELTGVLNMRAFNELSERASHQAERYARPYSVMMIDSDSLKHVNDTYGHETGNRLLKLTVQCIKDQLRETDIVARYGGDEFVVLLPETPCAGAVGVADRIRKRMESTPLPTRDGTTTVTVSIGIAGYPNHGADFDDVLEKADQAMYGSKSGGKNRTTMLPA